MNTLRKLILVSVLSGSLVGCAGSGKTQKQAATEQWNQTRATVLCSLANDQYRAGNLEKCRETLGQALPLDPTNAQLLLLSVRVDIEQGRLESAQKSLETVAVLAPKNGEVDYLMGVVQQRWQRPQLAREAYARAVEKQPDDVAYLLAEAEMMVQLDDADGALAMLKDRVTYFEHSAAIRDAIGQLLEGTGDLPGAIEFYRQASVLDAADLGTRERLGLALFQQGDYRDALSQFNRILREAEGAKRSDLKIAAGECELHLNAPSDARRRFDDVVLHDPTDALGWFGIAKASLAMNDVRRADYAVSRAATLPPTAGLPSTYALMGYVRVRQGRFEEAVKCFRKATAGEPRDTTSLCMLGVALSKLGKMDEAAECYAEALQANPSDELAAQLNATMTASAND